MPYILKIRNYSKNLSKHWHSRLSRLIKFDYKETNFHFFKFFNDSKNKSGVKGEFLIDKWSKIDFKNTLTHLHIRLETKKIQQTQQTFKETVAIVAKTIRPN